MKRLTNKRHMGYLFILPWLIGFLVFTLMPIAYSIYLSFNDVTFTATGIVTEFVGLHNFRRVATEDISFLLEAGIFVVHTLISVPLIIVLALIMALLLNQKVKMRGFFRTIFFLPVIISSGPVLNKLMDLGITLLPGLENYDFYHALLASDNIFIDLLLFILNNFIIFLWQAGVQILIFLAALQKMDVGVYEAARIDGANAWEIFWRITLPSLLPMILVNIVYTTVMYAASALNPIIELISSNMFKIETGFGYTSALSWIYFVVIIVALAILVGVFSAFERRQ